MMLDRFLNELAYAPGVAGHIVHDLYVGPLQMRKGLSQAFDGWDEEDIIDFLKDMESEVKKVLAL